jgi:AraC-like DNA-binding protein
VYIPASRPYAYQRRLGDPVFESVRRPPNQSFHWHRHGYPDPVARWGYHPEYELHLITQTSGRFFVGDYTGRFGPGNLVLTGPDLPHAWLSDLAPGDHVAGRDVVIQFRGEWLGQLIELCPELQVFEPMLERAARGVEFRGPGLPRQVERMLALGERREGERLSGFLDLLRGLADCEQRTLASLHYDRKLTHADSDRVDAILRLLQESFARPLRMSEIARAHGMSESAFSRFFSQATGSTFVAYLHRLRIEEACRALLETDQGIAQIGFAVGYGNLSNFNRHFLAETGVTPSQYRRQLGRPLPDPAAPPLP